MRRSAPRHRADLIESEKSGQWLGYRRLSALIGRVQGKWIGRSRAPCQPQMERAGGRVATRSMQPSEDPPSVAVRVAIPETRPEIDKSVQMTLRTQRQGTRAVERHHPPLTVLHVDEEDADDGLMADRCCSLGQRHQDSDMILVSISSPV